MFIGDDPVNDVIQIKNFKTSPALVSLSQPIIISAQVDVKEELEGPIQLKMVVKKDSGLFRGAEVPCQGGKFGSW